MSRQTPTRRVSLRFVLDDLRHAVEGARLLGDLDRHGDAPTAADGRLAREASAAVLGLVAQRLHVLDGVLAGEVDASLIATAQNTVEANADDDVLLPLDEGRR